jgi:hypothetical protein
MEFNNDVIDVEVVEATHLPIDFKITDLTTANMKNYLIYNNNYVTICK